MKDLIEFVLEHKAAVAISCIIVLLFVWVGLLRVSNSDLRVDLATAQTRLIEVSTANRGLAASIDTQNAAIAALQAEGQARQAEAAKAIAKAKESAAVYERTAMSLMSRMATGDECAATKVLLNEVVR